MIPLRKNQPPHVLLGLALDGSRLTGAIVRRVNGGAEVQQNFSAVLALDPLNHEPELVGQEIRNHLDAAEIRERRCVVCLPLHWALTLTTPLPALPETDLADLLQLEAERGFAYPPDQLIIATSRFTAADGERHATLVAIPRDHLIRLEKVLAAARLTAVSFSLGLPAIQPAGGEKSPGILAFTVGENGVAMQLTTGGGVAVLRALEGAFDTEGGERRLQTAMIARELRITLGQLSPGLRAGLHRLRVFGQSDHARQLAAELAPRVESLGLQLESVTHFTAEHAPLPLAANPPISPAVALAARQLAGQSTSFEFLPPKISAWQQFTSRYSSKKLLYAGLAAGFVLLVVAGLFTWQQWHLSQLRDRWSGMSAKVTEIENLQTQIKRFRPWFDDSYGTLSILRRVTEAFPEDGSVSAKSIEIRDLSVVTCSGTARDNTALLKTLDRLRATREIGEVKVDQIRGKSPLQFTFNFRWGKGGSHDR